MEFLVRIFFSGLIAFIPNQEGTELDVVLLNAGHAHHLSDGSGLPAHNPLMVVYSGDCTGDCPVDSTPAQIIYPDQTATTALASLNTAVGGGAVWQLNGSQLSFSTTGLPALNIVDNVRGTVNGQPLPIPTTSGEREDFSWIAKLSALCSTCTLDSDVLATQPPSGLVAARFKLRSGKVFTQAVARIGGDVTPVHFKRLDGTGSAASYTQAIASWVGAEIEISGDDLEIVESKFNGDPGRSMTLTPDSNGKIEIAVLNLPSFVPPASTSNDAPQVGKHFERYYDLADTAPSSAARLVPRAGAAPGAPSYSQVTWSSVHPSTAAWSALLNNLRLDVGRGAYDRTLCPPLQP